MKYNNIIFLGLCLGLTTYSALSADSVIKISGRVLDYGCTVSSDSLNFTVDLQKNSARQFPTTGSTSPAVPFQNTGYYKNEGTAENIQIELRDDQDAALKNGDSKTVIVDEITRNAQFPLKARAITVNGNASQGTIEALINVIYTWQ